MDSSEELYRIAEALMKNGDEGLARFFQNKAKQAERHEEYEKNADLWAIVRNS